MSSKFLDKTGLDTLWAKIKSTFQTLSNLVTAWGSTPSDTKYPSEKLVKTSLDAKAPNAPSEVTIANGDKMLIADASDSNKAKRASLAFDGSTTGQFLTKKGTFGKVLYADEAWGGDFRSSLSPVDTYLMIQRNCFFGPKLSAISVEYSTDGGTTWLDYGLTDSQKYLLFSQYNTGLICFCGKNTHIQPGYTGSISGTKDLSDANIADQRLRITICCESRANAGTSATTDKWIYANIRRIGIYASTNSASRGPRHCVFTARKKPDFRAGNDNWVSFGDFAIAGDSGWNSIPCNNSASESGITLGDSYDTQYCEFRFEIWSEGLNASPASSQTGNMAVGRIVAFSELCWTLSSTNPNLGNTGIPCSVDSASGVSNFSKGIKFTARQLAVSLSNTSTNTSFDGSANVTNIKTTGTLPVGNGGMGKTSVTSGNYLVGNGTSALTEKTPKQVGNNVLPALDVGGDNVFDTDYIIASNHTSGATDTTAFVRRTADKLWNYIKDKISSVLGLTATSYGGNAATATTATTAAGYTSGGAIDTALQGKVDKETGKGLSTNDYTTTDKNKVASAVQPGDLGTAAYKDVPTSGDASTTQVVMGSDSRLSDARPASDVSAWAKTATKPTYTASEVGAAASSHTHGNISNEGKSTSEPTSTTKFLRADGTWAAPGSVAYEHTNEVNVRNVPTNPRHYFNYRDGDTDAASPGNMITDYYFGNRNNGIDGVKLNADGINSPTRNNSGRMHFCIKITRMNTTENDFATIRVPFSSQNSEENFGYVEIIIKFRTNTWNARAFVFARGAYSKLGQAFYLQDNPNAVGGACYLGIDITDANVYIRFSPIIICHGTTANTTENRAMKIEFGDFTPSGSPSPLQTRWPAFIDYNNNSHSAIGSSAQPVYVDANGQVVAGNKPVQVVNSIDTSSMISDVLYVM